MTTPAKLNELSAAEEPARELLERAIVASAGDALRERERSIEFLLASLSPVITISRPQRTVLPAWLADAPEPVFRAWLERHV